MSNAPVTVVGNLTRDPELRYTTTGQALANIGVAVSHRRTVNGETTDETSFLNATVFGSLAENVAASLTKGARVIVTGRLQQRSYLDKSGEQRSATEIVADAVGAELRLAAVTVERAERTRPAATTTAPDDEEPF